MSYLLVNYGVLCEIDTTPFATTRSWAEVGAGFNDFSEALNEVVQDYNFLSDKGFGSTFVTGQHPKYTLSGVRVVGDAAQDFIFGQTKKYGLMAERNTTLRISLANASGTVDRITVPATLSNIQSFGGSATDGSAVSVEIAFRGKPVLETVASSSSLTVTSVAGATAGTTVLTVVPTFPDAGCKFVYAYGDTAPTATPGTVLTGWNDFVNGATYIIANGKKVTVALVNVSTFVVVGSGDATVVSGS